MSQKVQARWLLSHASHNDHGVVLDESCNYRLVTQLPRHFATRNPFPTRFSGGQALLDIGRSKAATIFSFIRLGRCYLVPLTDIFKLNCHINSSPTIKPSVAGYLSRFAISQYKLSFIVEEIGATDSRRYYKEGEGDIFHDRAVGGWEMLVVVLRGTGGSFRSPTMQNSASRSLWPPLDHCRCRSFAPSRGLAYSYWIRKGRCLLQRFSVPHAVPSHSVT